MEEAERSYLAERSVSYLQTNRFYDGMPPKRRPELR